MKKRILPIFFIFILCFSMLRPFPVSAAPLDPEATASLTLYYQKDGIAFPDQQIAIYRVAQAFPDGTFELIEPFSAYPVNIHGITMQEQWQHVATTLYAYLIADGVAPDAQAKTDADGIARFTELETGLYLVREVVAENNGGTYLFNQFMIYLPTPQTDGTFDYDMEARPKCTSFIPKTQYTVTKLWQDAGNQENRPREITVDIYKDGQLQETQVLSANNNWSYTWYVSDGAPGKWTVAERNVNASYKVSIQQNGSHFSIVNTCTSHQEMPPTGDRFSPLPWMMGLCFSGIMLLILGLYGRRRK